MSPLFWMHEVSGRMREIVMKFFDDQENNLDLEELNILKSYLKQWMDSMMIPSDEKAKLFIQLRRIQNKEQLKDFNFKLLKFGIDPF